MSPKRVRENEICFTDNDWRHVFEALKRVEEERNTCRGKWDAIYNRLPRNLKSGRTSSEFKKSWNNLSCEAQGKRKNKRNVGNVSLELLKEVNQYYMASRKTPVAEPVAPISPDTKEDMVRKVTEQGVPKAVQTVGSRVLDPHGDRANARDVILENPDSKEKSQSPSYGIFHWTSDFCLQLKDAVKKVMDKWSVAPGVTQQATCSSLQILVGLQGKTSPAKHSRQNEAGLDEVKEELSNSFFECYDMEAKGLAELIGNYALQTGKERILEKIEQELGFQRFEALLEEPSRSRDLIEAAFLPVLSRFRKTIIGAVQSATEALGDEVIKDVAIRELRKEM